MLSDEQDRRQAEFANHQLESAERADIRRFKFAVGMALGGFVIGGGFIVLIVVLTFFGTPEQTRTATGILGRISTGLGGFGIGYLMLSASRRIRSA